MKTDQDEAKISKFWSFFSHDSDFSTFMLLVKNNIGPTVLAMPHLFSNGGLYFSPGAFVVVVLFLAFNTCRHVLCSAYLSKRENVPIKTYSELVYVALNTCSSGTKRYATPAKSAIDFLIILTRIEGCAIYIVFVGTNVANCLLAYDVARISVRIIMFLEMGPLFIFCSVPNMKKLLPFFSTAANIMITLSIILIVSCFFFEKEYSPWQRTAYGNFWDIIRFTCIIFFVLNGLAISTTLRNNMTHPDHFFGWPGIFWIALTFLVICYLIVGCLGYLEYGEAALPNIIFNLPLNSRIAIALKFMTAGAVYYAIPIVSFIAVEVIVKNYVKPKIDEDNLFFAQYLVRYLVLALIYIRAIIIPRLGPMIVLKGALNHCILEVIVPPLVHIATYYPDKGFGKGNCWQLIIDIICCLFGIFMLITGTILALWDAYDVQDFANIWATNNTNVYSSHPQDLPTRYNILWPW